MKGEAVGSEEKEEGKIREWKRKWTKEKSGAKWRRLRRGKEMSRETKVRLRKGINAKEKISLRKKRTIIQ